MSRLMQLYISSIDRVNLRIGRIVMYGIFVLMGILLWSSISKTFFLPSLWTLEMAQFTMVAYYILGGPYSLQMGSIFCFFTHSLHINLMCFFKLSFISFCFQSFLFLILFSFSL